MPTLKEYNIKLARLRNTHKMTKTMKMVAANKLRKAQAAQRNAQVFMDHIAALYRRAAYDLAALDHPLLKERSAVRAIHCVLITSDRGLCGGFNNNLNRRVAQWMQENASRNARLHLSFCGRRGFLYFRNAANLRTHYEGISAKPSLGDVLRVGRDLQASFLSGSYDEVYLAYNVSKGVLAHTPVVERLLPLQLPPPPHPPDGLLYDPAYAVLIDFLLPKLVNTRLYNALMNSSVGEHGARMAAMENSTTNADNLITTYTLMRNRARQAAITRELIEIVAGAEALK